MARGVDQPFGEHAAAFAAQGADQQGDGLWASAGRQAGCSARTNVLRKEWNRRSCQRRVLDHLGAVEAGAQRGGMGVGAAQAAAHAAVDHGGHRVHLQRIGVVLERERGAARQADAGVVAGADVLVHAVLHALDALAALQQAGDPGLDAALALELAFALGHDHLQAVEVAGEGLFQRARICATS
jgi:hypothetical protein